MTDIRRLLVGIIVLSLSSGQGPPDNIGKQFVVSFMENDQYGSVFPLELYVTTSEKRDVHVKITSPKWSQPNFSKTITVQAGQVIKIDIDDEFRMKGSLKSSKTILVESDGDIAVYGGNKEDYSNDVFCGIPTDALGTEYYAMCYGPASRKTELGIASTQDGTIVKVTLPFTPNMTVTFEQQTYHSGDTITIPLDKYENFQLQSVGDLTGAHIVSNHPIAAFSGNIKTNVGTGEFQDHLVEQLTPVDTWGKRFVTAPIPKRTTGDYFRIIASQDNTVVNIAGMPSFTLAKAGDWKQVTLPSDSYKSINATKPVFMTQFVLSQLNPLEPADPSMMIIPPYELFNAGYTFATPEYSHPEYFQYENEILLVIESSKKDGLLLDGLPLPKGTKWNPIEGTTLVGTYIDIPKGSHTVVHKDSITIFGSYLYGHAYHESYAFPTGMRLAKINAPCNITTPVPGDGIDNDCDGRIDEELCTPDNNKNDDDGDGKIDEDCVQPAPVDGQWGSWSPWESCSVTCEKGVQLRNRSCDNPAPMYNGTACPGNDQESKPCDTGKNCPLDAITACKNKNGGLLANPIDCAQYYDCSQQKTSMGQDYLKECKYPDLFSTKTNKCEDFQTVTCDRRLEPQAPCEYVQNQCNGTNPSCDCPKRLPSCVGKPDGNQEFPGKRGEPDYINCFKNRTLNVTQCELGSYFDPRTRTCKPISGPVLNFYCRNHPTDKLPYPGSCAKFLDCSSGSSDRISECKYPDLFSTVTRECENFTTVNCDKRLEPQAPCEYDQNLCPTGNTTCQKCPERLPSCIGLPDGDNPIPNHEWTSSYITCYKNRTILPVHQCPKPKVYHPTKKICTEDIQPNEVPDFCKANPTAVIHSLTNCAEFYNCSNGNKAHECQYPDLFSKMTHKCENFTGVQCDNRTEPQAPCEYKQNQCNGTGCKPCPQRLPSCIGEQDGDQPFPSNLWMEDYVQCYKNRTMSVKKCPQGQYFHPQNHKCETKVDKVDIPDYCTAHPQAILPDPDNCAHYFNCSDPTSATITRAAMTTDNYRKECHYPDLYDDSIKQCNNFEKVNCDKKHEPQAPCEYQQNLCQAMNTSCDLCPDRLPSCVGKSDGMNPVPNKLWKDDYISCYKNRTMEVKKCPAREYFNPRLDKCMKIVEPVDVPDYCKVHPAAVIPDPSNCAKFYNCSQNMASKPAMTSECKYPDLFSGVTSRCERFQNVSCDTRQEPQAPCEYDQNLCNPSDMNCEACPKRLPSCRSLPDGDEAVQSALWTDLYVTCLLNRTMAVRHCPVGQVFDPNQLHCISKIPKGNMDEFCNANPSSIVPHPDSCGQYYNCSAMSIYGHHLQECHYPDLFDEVSLMCKNFEQVKCNTSKHEPEAPCEYLQNICNSSDPNCLPCAKRLPSCVGHPDGDNPFPNKLWEADYITCYKNRTLNVTHCNHGYFNPRTGKCQDDVPKVDVPDYCTAHPQAILPDPDNCAHYFNCSDPTSATITRAAMTTDNYRKECHYPDLYDDSIKQCNNFEKVNCDKKHDPQAPCEYQQNLCQAMNKSCDPCPDRLPSCVGKSDGMNPVPTKTWQDDYISCYKNRTMEVKKCPAGEYFNPRLDKCMKIVEPVDVPDYCTAHPQAILPDPDNCAHYFNCSDPTSATITRAAMTTDNYRKECHYPDLYDDSIKQCNNFEKVNCDKKHEPQAPCEYQQNLCLSANQSCDPCPERLPTCVSKSDGLNPFPTKMWQADYIKCYKNRTTEITTCPTGEYFNPRLDKCMKVVEPVDVPDYCKVHPAAVIPDPSNCAKFYNCSQNMASKPAVTSECKYPDLFSGVTNRCERFQNVSCDTRQEPQAPCEYDQNLCNPSDMNCEACPKRLPSCRSLPDGDEAVQSALWTDLYVACLLNRTMAVRHCPVGQVFDPNQLHCISKIPKGNIDDFCNANPSSIVPHPDTCGQYYNCSAMSIYGHHLQECYYPDLFDAVSLMCKNFEQVKCNTSKHEPEAPCEYLQNICNSSDPNCLPCPKRLPSCVGHPDGDNPFPNKLWEADYITCYKNRTLNVTHCNHGYFNPRTGKCQDDVPKVDVPDYCKAHPQAILPDPDNCAHYFNCSDPTSATITRAAMTTGNYRKECHYPDLYDDSIKQCNNFEKVNCDKKHEPQAPCEYQQNLCQTVNKSCDPCPDRLPSCVGKSDGMNPVPNKLWQDDYISCYKNRTMEVKKCPAGEYFNPRLNKCIKIVEPVDVPDYCTAHPQAILPDPDNCAHYFNCSDPTSATITRAAMTTDNYRKECHYPDLYDDSIKQCNNFEKVNCDKKHEPQAPCEYQQNMCQAMNQSCDPCPERLPTCVSKSDGLNPFPTKMWQADYIKCYKNRTTEITTCPTGEYFNPRLDKCMKVVEPVDVPDYCKVHPAAVIPDPSNCAMFYNCSQNMASKSAVTSECKYPDLFSGVTSRCERFQNVSCDTRQEPQAPCEYDQNLCNPSDMNCETCPKRLPSCRRLPDGDEAVQSALWTDLYVTCLLNRTMAVRHCPVGQVFDPNQLHCISKIPQGNMDEFCNANPSSIVPHPDTCGQYYNCSAMSIYGHHLQECHYPDLFDEVSLMCKNFEQVKCNTSKHEPEAPCEYLQNRCNSSDPNCLPCAKRLPSCVGHPDGDNPFPNKLWKADYITCYKNRTLNVTHCNHGYFNPRTAKCQDDVPKVDVPNFCRENPTEVLPDPENCAHFYDCSVAMATTYRGGSPVLVSQKQMECPYPDLFDPMLKICTNFTSVDCKMRKEPQSPCEYEQNLCTPGDVNCPPCPERLPSCVGMPDGVNVFTGREWKPEFVICFKNRTVELNKCTKGFYHPTKRICTEIVDHVDVPDYCKANPRDIIPDHDNCAHYFDCEKVNQRKTIKAMTPSTVSECNYPDLFDSQTLTCQAFTTVLCQDRTEPQAPCEYVQNLCNQGDSTCEKCPSRLPSCIGQSDGLQAFPGHLWEDKYIQCYKNRTMKVAQCPVNQYFNPRTLKCADKVLPVDLKDYCKAHPAAMVTDYQNCAKLYNCTDGVHTECTYPDLYNTQTQKCQNFMTTRCDDRTEPQAPCEYDQNLCPKGDLTCEPCPERLPSCRGAPDGDRPVSTALWTSKYVTCLHNRTMAVRDCSPGSIFNPVTLQCMSTVTKNIVDDVCKANPTMIKPNPVNCAQYYNCTAVTKYGHHLMECAYPDLFDPAIGQCRRFYDVKCGQKHEPMSPCEYLQNLCEQSNMSCTPCSTRLPSCIGLPDGANPFPGRMWKSDYITCDRNRTVEITHCTAGYFHPRKMTCTNEVIPVDVPDYCGSNPSDILADPDNCGRYFNCSMSPGHARSLSPLKIASYHMECRYPDLFDLTTMHCADFESVKCPNRTEPQAPCEYQQHLCPPGDLSCTRCPERLPSCVGLSDGLHAVPTKLWMMDYIVCYKNRTLNVTQCARDEYFNPRLNSCLKTVIPVDVPEYCKAHRTAVIPDPDNCAKYYNCTNTLHQECRYPDLYDPNIRSCEKFTSVSCDNRTEPQAPCTYDQNQCPSSDPSCKPCDERLPSCVGLPDGLNVFPGKIWKADYIQCYKNRTIDVKTCSEGYFHPVQKICMTPVQPVDVKEYCKANPADILPDPDNCSHFYNCTKVNLSSVTSSTECNYPDLFSPVTLRCEMFTTVRCEKRPEPKAPCEYEKNICSGSQCEPCPERLPSCVGSSDGNHAFPTLMWKSDYITCYKNRTINIRKCTTGYFHPLRQVCMVDVISVDVPDYCKANPTEIIPDSTNCAQYHNCSDPTSQYKKECTYPDLFSTVTLSCERFQMVACGKRPEPQAPCEYDQNLCTTSECQPCPSRLPSCVGVPDGDRPFPVHLWTDLYITCLTNRTIAIRHCPSGSVFDPARLQCVNRIEQGNLENYCTANPTAKKRHPTNCAKYIDCSTKPSPYGDYIKECTYPDLFSKVTLTCQNFTTVNCIPLQEPLSPCEYEQNLCKHTDVGCIPCSSRLPSCVGLPDGVNYYPGKLWTESFVKCFRNRTISVEKCPSGYFHPRQNLCVTTMDRVDIPDYCQAHLDAILPDPANCGHFFNCSYLATHRSLEISECAYPDLFSVTTRKCEPFTSVQCQQRYEPRAPCEYVKNLCLTSDLSCVPCPGRLPSCIGLSDGLHSFPGREWMEDYIKCYKNRTIEVTKCQTGYFNPTLRMCTTQLDQNSIPEYCRVHPTSILPKGDNCGQYYNCSVGLTRYGRNVMECPYPDLFSSVTNKCEKFTSVMCQNRPEHQSPCEYEQNLCYNDPTCPPCSSRLPSCVGLQDGPQVFTGKMWTDLYITCQQNRTISIDHCLQSQVFDPNSRQCIGTKNIKNIDEFCRANPGVIQEYPDNCAMYINCSATSVYYNECNYPDLYSPVTKTCQPFKSVKCGTRWEPQQPCDYPINLCRPDDLTCIDCRERLPSCVGLKDGLNAHPYKLWGSEFIVCDQNRTIQVDQCSRQSYFNPKTMTCTVVVQKVDVIEYCRAHPHDVLPDPDNCAHFYRCIDQRSNVEGQTGECSYPDLFSTATKSCESFTTVNCGARKEPQAPCDYQKNLCGRNGLTCIPCPDRLPSCVGNPDGANPFPTKMWSPDYITCLINRTITVSKCPNGQFFNPDLRQCTDQISTTDIDSFCRSNPTSLKPHPSNCAQYYNCSDVGSRYGRYLEECTYPDLFSPVTMTCQNFQSVSCNARHEPKAPCEYRALVCDGSTTQCTPCPERLPSCIGLTDGPHLFPGREWTQDYILCYKNRTTVGQCNMGYFNPRLHQCTSDVAIIDIPSYCRSHRSAILPHPTNCAKYFRCPSHQFDSITYEEECSYPDLFSTLSMSCQNFTSVSCGSRQEPQAPCEYQQNQCEPGNFNCIPCTQRLYSCRGLPDGENAVPGHRWSNQYITCYRNRTVSVHLCPSGMFDPIKRLCDDNIDKDNIDEYCRSHPTSVLPHPNNCAQYFSCTDKNSQFGHYLEECPYPQLFSSLTKTCVNFTSAQCQQRFVPQAPCEYLKNQNGGQISRTVPCPERLPSCIGLPDGSNTFPGRKWMTDYILCYRNRTLQVLHCDQGYYFDPYIRTCVRFIETVYITEFCQANPTSVVPSMSNCAQYYHCQDIRTSSVLKECSYPDLFSVDTMTCQRFSLVDCQQRPQPLSPCEYLENQCKSDNTNCIPCSQRLPSCVGQADGNNPLIGHYWSADYLVCLRNRTISVEKCQTGLFDPVSRRCTIIIDISNIVSICTANPNLKFENQQNCAQYYDCSSPRTGYLVECQYPDLYSTIYQECRSYRTVMCGMRQEPQAPCDYVQNLCKQGEISCTPCPDRHPSCVGLPDGRNALVPWTNQYVECLKNRTITTGRCTSGIFNPIQRICILYMHPGDILKYCQQNPTGVIAKQDNAAQFYDCTKYSSPNGHYLMECPYPQLFSTISLRCEDFITITPDKRPIPQAPCEYMQYQCNPGDTMCTLCETVHHSCIGKPDGDQPITYKTWQSQYVNCYQNRTIQEKVCNTGLFDPLKRVCSDSVNTDQIDVYCKQHPLAIVKHPGDCAMYYNCSNPASQYGPYIEECHYPDLFSTLTLRCEYFQNVACKPRHEPQAPCEYQQNLCKSTDPNCQPCSERLPSCVGLPDGFNPILGRLWSKDYIQCHHNRTINVLHCNEGFFDPDSRMCVTAIKSGDANEFCKTNPRILIRSSENCAQYIDCRRWKRRIGGFVKECPYPDLFNPHTLECNEFTRVTCGNVQEPQAPCSYEQNICLNQHEKCVPCPERLPSCIGLPNGENPFAGRIWSSDYVTCYLNRTTSIKKCATGFFDPTNRKCSSQVGTENIELFCTHHPDAKIPNKVNCAQYYDCSNKNSIFQPYLHECTYPKLFSVATLRCEDFEQVTCGARTEPKAPCQYLQNQCSSSDQSCLPCTMRLPSCLQLPDGDNSYPGHHHWKQYISCYKERTQAIKDCTIGYFDQQYGRCLIEQHTTPIPTCGVDQFECNNGQCINLTGRCNDHFDCTDLSDEQNCIFVPTCPEGQWRCHDGQCIDPMLRCDGLYQCRDKSDEAGCHYVTTPRPAITICNNQQNGRVEHPTNCAKYYDCADQSHPLLQECPYPFLYSPIHMSCQNFEYVQCHQRYEPKTPCEYDQNKCQALDTGCTPCIERLPSCMGLPDGRHAFPGQLWTSKFILCHLNRTIDVGECPEGQKFNPDGRFCIVPTVNVGRISDYCKHNPAAVLAHPDSCAQYYNCSNVYTLLGSYIEECPYPQLFDINTRRCLYYTEVNCDRRTEPKGPCDYELNKCHTSDCKPCEDRFVSCVGKPDGDNSIPDVELSAYYVICKDERTITKEMCQTGYIFSPVTRTCIHVDRDSLDDVCEKYSGITRPHPYNCAQFIDCSTTRPGFPVTKYIKECHYPQMFSTETLECHDFEHVTCDPRHEPVAPCEYLQNLCSGTDPNCERCVDRLPSCRQLPDGKNPISTKLWTPSYLTCHKNRTLSVDKCTSGVFDPYKKECVNDKKPPVCTGSNGLVAKGDNCAQFYDCSKPVTEFGQYLEECPYPQLFNQDTQQCEHFTQVDCRSRYEPKAPCDYFQSQCIGVGCQVCEKTHPSCVGLPDGANPYPEKPLSPDYIICDHGRTISTELCNTGIFDPSTKMCRAYSPDMINSFCQNNHGLVLPSPDNCAHFYQCGVYNEKTGSYLHECAYPNLYDVTKHTCKHFTEVNCGSRHEPKSPCEYLQNQCHTGDGENCLPCPLRLPSCVGLSNGRHWHPDPGRISQYITCEGERTIAIDDCPEGMYFEQIVKDCLPLKFYSLLLAFSQGQEVCKSSLVSGVTDDKLTATSQFGSGDPLSDYGPSRGKLNNKETMDNTGKTLIGAWVSGTNDVNQYIQVELPSPSLIRGIITQGRDGCCKQWTTKYRVMYSMDCKTDWKPVQQLGSTDTFFKGNSDENTPETNMFDCPVIAKCLRVNPLEWNNHAALRFDLIGCSLDSGSNTGSTGSNIVTAPPTASVPMTTAPTTQKVTVAVTTAAPTTVETTTQLSLSGNGKGGKFECIKDCVGKSSGYYGSCKTCFGYVTCVWGIMYERDCPTGLRWNSDLQVCDYNSNCSQP